VAHQVFASAKILGQGSLPLSSVIKIKGHQYRRALGFGATETHSFPERFFWNINRCFHAFILSWFGIFGRLTGGTVP
jgi:hypothetical protein